MLIMSIYVVGCAPSLRETLHSKTLHKPISSSLPIKIDVEASEIIWSHPISIDKIQPHQLRREIATSLERAMNGQESIIIGERGYIPSRYLLEVHKLDSSYLWAILPCIAYLTIVGCPTHSISADITLTIEYQNKIYSISATGKSIFNIYNGLLTHQVNDLSPVAIALREAIIKLAKQIKRNSASHVRSTSSPLVLAPLKPDHKMSSPQTFDTPGPIALSSMSQGDQ